MAIFAQNKKAYSDYQIIQEIEAGLVLNGQQVKSIRLGRMKLNGAYIVLKKNKKKNLPEVYLIGSFIPAYQSKNAKDYNPEASIKLLLNKSEIKFLVGKLQEKGITLVPLKVYPKNVRIKITIGIAKGKKKKDKREEIKKREIEREIRRTLKTKF